MKYINQKLLANRSIYLSLSYQERAIGLSEIVRDWKSELNATSYYWNLSQTDFIEIDKNSCDSASLSKKTDTVRNSSSSKDQTNSQFERVISKLKKVYHTSNPGIYLIENVDNLLTSDRIDLYQQETLKTWIINITNKFQKHAINGEWYYLVLLGTNNICWELENIIPKVKLPFVNPNEAQQLLAKKFNELRIISSEKNHLISKAGNLLSGLTKPEIIWGINLIQNSLPPNPTIETYLDGLVEYKLEKLRNLGLEFLPIPPQSEVGGMDLLKEAIADLENEFAPEARLDNIPLPKGWLLAGVPGSGKSWVAKCMSAILRLPMIYIGIDKIKSKGAAYLADLLKLVEAVSPNIVYFDEFDKLFGDNDEGSKAVLGVLLTWLQEKKGQSFALATLNRLDALPPEMTRAGRFDKVFYVGFPQPNERVEITKLHLQRYDKRFKEGFDFEKNQWRIFLNKTVKFTGAELASVVEKTSRYKYRLKKLKIKEIEAQIALAERKILASIDPKIKNNTLIWNKDKGDILNLAKTVNCNPEILIEGNEVNFLELISEVVRLRKQLTMAKNAKLILDFENLLHFAEQETSLYERNTEGVAAIENRAREVCEPVSSKDNSGWIPDDLTYWPDPPAMAIANTATIEATESEIADDEEEDLKWNGWA